MIRRIDTKETPMLSRRHCLADGAASAGTIATGITPRLNAMGLEPGNA